MKKIKTDPKIEKIENYFKTINNLKLNLITPLRSKIKIINKRNLISSKIKRQAGRVQITKIKITTDKTIMDRPRKIKMNKAINQIGKKIEEVTTKNQEDRKKINKNNKVKFSIYSHKLLIKINYITKR